MLLLKIAYDTKSNKLGVVIPRYEKELLEEKGVVRFFKTTNSENDWQTLDTHFIICGEVPIIEKFTTNAIKEFISREYEYNNTRVEFLNNLLGQNR